MIKHGLIPEAAFMDVTGANLRAWDIIEPVFAIARRRGDRPVWKNFECLVVRARHWGATVPAACILKVCLVSDIMTSGLPSRDRLI